MAIGNLPKSAKQIILQASGSNSPHSCFLSLSEIVYRAGWFLVDFDNMLIERNVKNL